MDLRPYQVECQRAIYRSLRDVRRTLVVLATGLGKTIVFSSISRDAAEKGRRVLILAHREELVTQAADKFTRVSGLPAAIEMADRAEALQPNVDLFGDLPSVVVASVQSMVRRLDKFPREHFNLVVIDEAHHAPAETYRKILDHFECKVLGVTATPDRGDKKALAQVFEDVAYKLDIRDAVDEGWLVPITQKFVQVDKLNLSRCRTTAGDLNAGDLEAAMTEMGVLEEVAGPTIEEAGSRPTLLFAVTVAHAHALAEVLRGHTSAGVAALDGSTDKDERRRIVDAFKAGDIQFLVNCALFTEGFDAPPTACVAMARPTKSRNLYEQMIGRGTRTLDGVLDGLGDMTAEVRRHAIAQSRKPDLKVLDFVGNSGRHTLVNMLDVLGGDMSPPERKAAEDAMKEGDVNNVLDAIREAKRRISTLELEKIRQEARKNFKTIQVDPFVAMGVDRGAGDMLEREAPEAQKKVLQDAGINPDGLDRSHASRLIGEIKHRREAGLATYKQVNRLIRSGLDRETANKLSFQAASALMTKLVAAKWRPPEHWGPWLKAARGGRE